jgi:hypothetical protein
MKLHQCSHMDPCIHVCAMLKTGDASEAFVVNHKNDTIVGTRPCCSTKTRVCGLGSFVAPFDRAQAHPDPLQFCTPHWSPPP